MTKPLPYGQRDEELVPIFGSWERYFGPIEYAADDRGDFEVFVEQASRLRAAVEAVGESRVWLRQGIEKAAPLLGGDPVTIDSLADFVHFGTQSTEALLLDPSLRAERAADRYYELRTFGRFCGRDVAVCGHFSEVDGPTDCREIVDEVHARRGRRIVVKAARAKHGLWFLDVPENASRQEVHRLLSEELDWALVRFNGLVQCAQVQDVVPMEHEYRFFIVDGRPVTGSGCVDALTPADEDTQVFSPYTQRRRGDDEPISSDMSRVAEYLRFAEIVAGSLSVESPNMTSYVLDVAMSDGKPVIVELNPLLNAGLYASDPRVLLDALIAQHSARAAV